MKRILRITTVAMLCSILLNPFAIIASTKHHPHHKKYCYETHDYVVIGGGTAGLTLAYLLKKAGKDVVVLEAGRNVDEDSNILNAMPLNELEVQYRNEYFWTGDAKPLAPTESRSTNVHANHYDGGRVLGGTSSTNDTIWWRAQQHTYDQAGGLFADPLYLDRAFKALETYTGTSQEPAKRGHHGPVMTTQGPTIDGVLQVNPISVKFSSAVQTVFATDYSIDIPLVDDYNVVNGSFVSNFSQVCINPDTLQRSSASIAYLSRRIGKKLDIRLDSQVLKIGFKCNKAKSVTYLQNDKVHIMKAKKKIILCAGHNTPAMLLQNGIGDAALLESLGIDVVYDNPEVGKNLKNHIFVPIVMTVNPADAAVAATYPVAFKRISGGSALPEPGNPNSAGRDYQLVIVNIAGNIATMILIFVNPVSKGTVSIVAKDPLMVPGVINLDYLTEPADMVSMVNGVNIAKRVIQEMHAVDPTYNLVSDLSNPAVFVNGNTSAFHHWHGQALVGKVVDETLHVIGVENLMVADMTIFPLTDGNSQTQAYTAGCAAYSYITGDTDIKF